MEPMLVAVVCMLVLAVWLLLQHRTMRHQESEQHPKWASEVYYADLSYWKTVPTVPPATPEQIALYQSKGGTDWGARGVVMPAAEMPAHYTPAPGSLSKPYRGYGPKPPPGTPGVYPFNAQYWFHPAAG